MSAISLEKSVRTCDVNVGEANRIQSDRFFNPGNMVCIPWNGVDNAGRMASPDSFYTKTAGCDSAEDRVMVENGLRPKYFNYVTLGAGGLAGHIYGNQDAAYETAGKYQFDKSRDNIAGNFGYQWGANVDYQSCSAPGKDGSTAYERNMAQMSAQAMQNKSQGLRNQVFLQNGAIANGYQGMAGNR